MSYKSIKQAIISVGGKGTRLKGITGDTPKPLYPIAGISCFERSLIKLKYFGILEVYLLTSYNKDFFHE